ncbi:MAG: GNAT family N-acetyltransferase [Ignavibacteriaceae bacterium]|nr:GNAT family N-acetyltransferase [Ignavibacteriaceae bacterium]
MEPPLVIRNAASQDIDFIIETIIEAEKSLTNKISYCNIFSLTEDELISIFRDILSENVTGQELCYSDYLIAEINGEYAGACGAWVEGANGSSSAVLKADILFGFIPHEKIRDAKRFFTTLQELNIKREKDTLQIANAYVNEKFRGKGLVGKLINEHIKIQKELFPQLKKAQLRPTITNESAFKAYNKLGFELIYEKSTEDEKVLDYLPARGKYLMEKILS